MLTRLRWFLALGAAEFLAISLWLDTDHIAAKGILRLALKKLPDVILFGLVAVALAVLLGGSTAWTRLKQEIDQRRISAVFPWNLYGLHLLCLAGFAVCGSYGISRESMSDASANLWLGASLACAAAAGILWLAGLLPVALWHTAIPFGVRGLAAAAPMTVAAWAISRSTRDSWRTLSEPTLNAVLTVLKIFGQVPAHDPKTLSISLGSFAVGIDPACSGYQGFGVMAVFAVVYVWAFRQQLRFPQAWLLVPMALVASWCGNVVRIASLLCLGAYISPEVALGGFHSQAGWLFLILVSVLFVGVAQRLPFFSLDVKHAIRLRESSVAACLAPFLLWNIIGLVSMLTAEDPAVDPLYPARWISLIVPVWYWRTLYGRLLAVNAASLVGILTGAIAFGLWMILEQSIPADSGVTETTAKLLSAGTPEAKFWLASRVIGSCLAAPFLEELAFRGYLMRRLQAFRFENVSFPETAWPGLLISSLAFGVLHGERWLAGVLVGLIYALTVRLTGRLSSGVLAHAATNALVTAYVLATGDYARWH